MKTLIPALAALSTFAVAACGGEPAAPAPEAAAPAIEAPASAGAELAAPVTAEGAFVKEPTAGRDIASGGVTLVANGQDLRLIGASTPLADRVELHTMSRVDGMMRMEQIDGIDLPAGVPVSLAGGGDHLMLFGVQQVDPDAVYPLLLTVEDADGNSYDIEVEASIQRLGE